MKRITTLLLSLEMLANFPLIGHCAITQETKDSMYLPHNSWIVSKLEEKIHTAHYQPARDWQNKISVGYTCVDSGAPESNESGIKSIVQNNRGIGLSIPLERNEGQLMTDLYAGIIFEKPYEIIDVVETIGAERQPIEGGNCKVELYNSGANFETYEEEITAMEEKEEQEPPADFTFNAETKIYQVNMDTYTYGYILEDNQSRKIFWCCKAVNEFEKGKFYKLADVLNAYKDYKERTTGITSPYVRWV